MQLAIHQRAFPATYTTVRALQTAAEMGYEAMELCAGEGGPLYYRSTSETLQEIREQATTLGIGITALTCAAGWRYPVTHADATVRKQGIDALNRTLELAHELQVDTVTVVPGKIALEAYFDIAFKNACTSFEALLPRAQDLGVCIALENVHNNFLLSPVEVIHFLNQFPGHHIRACLNVGHVMSHGTPQNWIQKLGPRLQRVHVSDYKASSTTRDGYVALGKGDVEWLMVMRALRNIGYTQPLIADLPLSKRAPETALHQALVQLRAIRALLPPQA